MKSKFTTIILFFVMILLIVGIGVIGYMMYTDIFGSNPSEIIYKIDNIITEKTEESKDDQASDEYFNASIQNVLGNYDKNEANTEQFYTEKTINQYFYNQLNDTQKTIYDGLKQNRQNLKKGDYIIEFGKDISDILSKENGEEELGADYQTAIEAFTHDNPDVFYLNVNKMWVNFKTITKFFKTSYEVYISPKEGENYLSSDFSNENKINEAMLAIESVKNSILANAKGTDYQKVLYIHDYLINNIEYDSTYEAIGTYNIYGALVGKRCVCEGYAKAFKYLLNEAGIECEMMQGIAINKTGERENHAWNCVKLKNNWYEVDATWDDPIIYNPDGTRYVGVVSNGTKYRYFLKGTNTFEKDHILSYQFSDGGKNFTYPMINSNDY